MKYQNTGLKGYKMDTIGDMIDKLTIANVRLWMLEDSRREFCKTEASKTESEIKDFI